MITETLYDPSTGDQSKITGPYLIADAVSKRPIHTFAYDEFGRVVTAQQADGSSLQYSYSLGSRSVTDPIGRMTTVTFDTLAEDVTVAGRLPAVYRGGTVRNAFGLVTAIYDADKNQSNISYDGFNRKRQELLPAADILQSGAASATFERPSISYTHDNGDRLLSRSDANGQPTTFEYDSRGRLSTTKGPDGRVVESRTYVEGGYGTRKVTVRDSRLGVDREEHLDGLGRVWKQIAFDGTATVTDYDSRGRAWRVTLPWGEVRTTEIQRGGLTTVATSTQADVVAATTSTFDASGRPLTVTDADGQIITNKYDLMGRLVTTSQGKRELERRKYDSAGRPVQLRSSGALTCLVYDSFDNVVLEERGCLDDGLSRISPEDGRGLVNVQRTYTNLNQVDTEIDGIGNKTDRAYDALGRLVSIEVIDASSTSLGKKQFSYDAVGNETKSIDELDYESRSEYDVYNRLTSSNPPDQGVSTTTYVASPGS
ncbi:MAG: hypothetical protein ACREA0_03415 [bacterium]